jgi:hypothetical protein
MVSSGCSGWRDLLPQGQTARLEPDVELGQAAKRRRAVPDPPPRVLDILLDLAFLPAGGTVAELGLEQIVARHRREAGVDRALLARADAIDCGAHVVVDATARDATPQRKGVVVRVEQHLLSL